MFEELFTCIGNATCEYTQESIAQIALRLILRKFALLVTYSIASPASYAIIATVASLLTILPTLLLALIVIYATVGYVQMQGLIKKQDDVLEELKSSHAQQEIQINLLNDICENQDMQLEEILVNTYTTLDQFDEIMPQINSTIARILIKDLQNTMRETKNKRLARTRAGDANDVSNANVTNVTNDASNANASNANASNASIANTSAAAAIDA